MKWVVLVIVVSLGAYTYLTLHYRKESPAFRPYQDSKNRAGVMRLLSAGFQRVTLTAQRPADGAGVPEGAKSAATAGGLPAELRSTLLDLPLLPASITRVAAAGSDDDARGGGSNGGGSGFLDLDRPRARARRV